MRTPDWQSDGSQLYIGDVLECLAALPDESVQCVVTSPPYWQLRNYNVDGQLGLEKTPDEYVAALVGVFREVRRVLRDDGTIWVNLGDSYAANGIRYTGRGDDGTNCPTSTLGPRRDGLPNNAGMGTRTKQVQHHGLKPKDLVGIPWRVAFALQADGWYLRSDIIWHKPNPMPESVTDRPTKSHEYMFLLTKQGRYFWDQEGVKAQGPLDMRKRASTFKQARLVGSRNDGTEYVATSGRNIRTVWTIATHCFPGAHFATFPPALVEPCIKAGTSEKGACPECGKPWEREVENTRYNTRPGRTHKANADRRDGYNVRHRPELSVRTLSWHPTCPCDAGEPVPCVVLDPFSGAATTGVVAIGLGRHYIGIDLNEEYTRTLAIPRLEATQQGEYWKVPTEAQEAEGQMRLF